MFTLLRVLYLAWKLRHAVKGATIPAIKPEIEIVGSLLKDVLKSRK